MASPELEFIKLDVQGRIQHIQENLLKQDPLLAGHLAAIHSSAIQYEELVHLLSDAEIKSWLAGQMKHVGVQLTKEITGASKATISKRIPKATADDF
jgi:hypothetical protein